MPDTFVMNLFLALWIGFNLFGCDETRSNHIDTLTEKPNLAEIRKQLDAILDGARSIWFP
jgi:hypothetical protein